MLRSVKVAVRGGLIGLVIGIIGGGFGTVFAQYAYEMVSTSPPDSPETVSAQSNVFSSALRERLKNANARQGEIEIALIWENQNDLDLHVTDPFGETISYSQKKSNSGGELDVDFNAGCGKDISPSPVEHIVWDNENAPDGRYIVYVHHYMKCVNIDPSPFQVEIKIGNQKLNFYKGIIKAGDRRSQIATFDFNRETLKNTLEGSDEISAGPLFPRILGWSIFGVLLGVGEGLRRKSVLAFRNSILGGWIGGAFGGFLFYLIAMVGLSDTWSRLIGFVVIGASIGLWIVIIEQALSAVLSFRNGAFEGRQVFLDRPAMRIGFNDSLEIYLGKGAGVASHHATLRKINRGHYIESVDGDVFVNGVECSNQALNDGDTITIGKTRLSYQKTNRRPLDSRSTTPQQRTQVKSIPPPPPPKKRPATTANQSEDELIETNSAKTKAQDGKTPELKNPGAKRPPPPPPKRK